MLGKKFARVGRQIKSSRLVEDPWGLGLKLKIKRKGKAWDDFLGDRNARAVAEYTKEKLRREVNAATKGRRRYKGGAVRANVDEILDKMDLSGALKAETFESLKPGIARHLFEIVEAEDDDGNPIADSYEARLALITEEPTLDGGEIILPELDADGNELPYGGRTPCRALCDWILDEAEDTEAFYVKDAQEAAAALGEDVAGSSEPGELSAPPSDAG